MTVSSRDLDRDHTPETARAAGARRRAFTLTELLVVIALIALLVSLLLAALGQVRNKAKSSTTQSTMQSFSNAVESFHQEHGEYPGVVPQRILANEPKISGTENAILHLVGGYLREDETDQVTWDAATGTANSGWQTYSFTDQDSPGGQFKIKVNRDRMGDGPIVNRKPHAPYFTPGQREMAVATGQWNPVDGETESAGPDQLPDLIDAWGQPIIHLHRARRAGELVQNPDVADAPPGQFEPSLIFAYTGSEALGAFGINQQDFTILPYAEPPLPSYRYRNLARILEHPAIGDQSRGAFVLISAGADGTFYSKNDGPEVPDAADDDDDAPPPDLGKEFPDDPKILDEYDDVTLFGGT